MRIFLTLFSFFILLGGMKGANWPSAAVHRGTYSTAGGSVNTTITSIANYNYVIITVVTGDAWTLTGSGSNFGFSLFTDPGTGMPPDPATAPISTSTGSLTLTSPGTYYILFTFTGPPNRSVTISGVNTPLPVTWLSFELQIENDGVLVSWSTASETNNDFFFFFLSANGRSFESFGEIKGAGYSNLDL